MNVLLVSPVNPFRENNGYKIAVWSDILAINGAGANLTVLYSYLKEEGIDSPDMEGVRFDGEPVKSGNRFVRSIRGLFSNKPAAVERYYTDAMQARIRHYLSNNDYDIVILEDCALAGWIGLVREESPSSRIMVRSHNFMQAVTQLQFKNANIWLRLLYYIDYLRWVSLEKMSVEKSDAVWAITDDEKYLISKYYGSQSCFYVPVSIDVEKYMTISVDEGDDKSFCHLGEIDMKKAPGIYSFINNTWPCLKKNKQDAQFHLGGRVTGFSVDEVNDVFLHDYVKDDVEFYRKSRFSVNPQIIGAGVKLKSLVSLACGRVLLSTPIGVEGLNIEDGVHYFNYTKLEGDAELNHLFDDMVAVKKIATAGRQWVCENHSREVITSKMAELLNDL